MQENSVPVGLLGWTTITVTGYVTACDPGCNHTSSYRGTKRLSELSLGQELTDLVTDPWWRSSIRHRFDSLYLIEVRPDGALFRYGKQEVFVASEKSKKLEQIPLDYAYGELYVRVQKETGDFITSKHDIFSPEAYDAILKAAENGDAEAITHLAYIRFYGIPRLNLPADRKEAHRLWEKAAAMGNNTAMLCCAINYYFGEEVEEDKAKAFDMYLQLEKAGFPAVYQKLSDIYATGIEGVVEQDWGKMIDYANKAYELGYMDAGVDLGMAYYYGNGVEEDKKKAFDYFYPKTTCSGKWASGWANYFVGLYYEEGLAGVQKDLRTAYIYIEHAAIIGNATAMVKAGVMLASGEGTPMNYEAAVIWFENAMNAGEADGAYYLAYYYSCADGGNDPEKADKYQQIAADMGHEIAQQEIEQGVSPNQLPDEE